MTETPAQNVLVIDDDLGIRESVRDILQLDGYRVQTAATVAEALSRDNWDDYFAILLDRKLPDGTADKLLPLLATLAPGAAIVVVTGYADLDGAVAALRAGSADYLLKPLQPDVLRATLARIADRQRVERARQRSESAFRRLVEAAECAILIARPDLRLLYFSPYAERLTGFSSQEMLGPDAWKKLATEPTREAHEALFKQVIAGQSVSGREIPLSCRDGSQRWLVWNMRKLPDGDGEAAVLAVGQDITELKLAQERLLQAERLAAIGQMVTGLAHESRNALQRSQACLSMLSKRLKDQPESQQLLLGLQEAQEHLYRLYEEVRGYAAPVRVRPQAYDVSRLVQEAWQQLLPLHSERDARILAAETAVDPVCEVDPFAMQQVFRNVLENSLAAVEGSVVVEVALRNVEGDKGPALEVSLRDNGPGLTGEARKRIFEPFFTTRTHGTGLGMAISRRLVEAHGGRIAVGPTADAGAEIVIHLPRRRL